MKNQSLKNLLSEIQIAKTRLAYFEAKPEKGDAMIVTLKQLLNLYEEVYQRSIQGLKQEPNHNLLVFTESSPDGVIVTPEEYENARKFMTKYDQATHVVVSLDFEEVV